jgi:hypothetical protein
MALGLIEPLALRGGRVSAAVPVVTDHTSNISLQFNSALNHP